MINGILKAFFNAYSEAKADEIKDRKYQELFYGGFACSPEYLSNLYNSADTEDQEDLVIEYINETRSYDYAGYKQLYNKHIERRR
jgi:hypothetical protein